MAKKILMVVTSHGSMDEQHQTGIWLSEFAEPYEIFAGKGFSVMVASPKGGEAPIDPRSLNEETKGKWGSMIELLKQTVPLEKVNAAEYDAIFLPGGHGTMFDLPDNPCLQKILRDYAEANKPIAAVCHGPSGLVGATLPNGDPLVKGKRLTAFTNEEERATGLDKYMPFLLEDRLRELGAQFVAAPKWSDHAEQDGLLITGQNPQSSISVANALVKALGVEAE